MKTERDFPQTQRRAGRLVAVLTNPPLSDGTTTRARVHLAREILGFQEASLANLFARPTRTSLDIAQCGISEKGWIAARPLLGEELERADGVLLAYGTVGPSGPARIHYREQIDWLQTLLDRLDVPIWQLGDGPRHPSRWQRWTSRTQPGLPFLRALETSFVRLSPPGG